VSPEDESEGDTSGQGLIGQQAGEPETVLVEVPAGADAALYLVETRGLDEGNYWVSLKEVVEEGEVLTHIEVGWESDEEVQGLSRDGDVGTVQFLLPNEEITEEIAEQVRELLEGSDVGTEGSRVWGMSSEQELDWDRAEVVLLGNPEEGEEVEALLVIPAGDDGAGTTEGQQLWGRTRPAIDPQRATYVSVRVRRTTSTRDSLRYTDELKAVKQLLRLAQSFDDRVPSILERWGRILPELIRRGIMAVPSEDVTPLELLSNPLYRRYGTLAALVSNTIALSGNPEQARDVLGVELDAALRIVDTFLGALERLLVANEDAELTGKILDKIPGPRVPPRAPVPEDVKQFLVFAELLSNIFTQTDVPWDLIDIDLTVGLGLFRGSVTIEIVATAQIPGLGQVTTFANSYSNIKDLSTNEIHRIINTVQSIGNDPRYPGLDVAFIFIHDETSPQDVENKLPASSAVPLVVVYCKENCDSANPVYGIAWRGPINEQQAWQIACAHGYTQFCGEGAMSAADGYPQEPPTVTIPPPPPPPPPRCLVGCLTPRGN